MKPKPTEKEVLESIYKSFEDLDRYNLKCKNLNNISKVVVENDLPCVIFYMGLDDIPYSYCPPDVDKDEFLKLFGYSKNSVILNLLNKNYDTPREP